MVSASVMRLPAAGWSVSVSSRAWMCAASAVALLLSSDSATASSESRGLRIRRPATLARTAHDGGDASAESAFLGIAIAIEIRPEALGHQRVGDLLVAGLHEQADLVFVHAENRDLLGGTAVIARQIEGEIAVAA